MPTITLNEDDLHGGLAYESEYKDVAGSIRPCQFIIDSRDGDIIRYHSSVGDGTILKTTPAQFLTLIFRDRAPTISL